LGHGQRESPFHVNYRQSATGKRVFDGFVQQIVGSNFVPYSYTGFWRELQRAGADSGIGPLGTHAFRHTYRSWLDAVGTPIAVQQKLMRHSDIRTTMNIYGSVVTNEMEEAGSRVVGLALRPVN
jgi:integrase